MKRVLTPALKRHPRRWAVGIVTAASIVAQYACGGAEEAPRVSLPVVVDSRGLPTVTNDRGYGVTLTEARTAIENIEFTVAGEAHTTSFWRRVSDFLLPKAVAHPGHFQGGEVTGELRGRFVLGWVPATGKTLGTATLLGGTYTSANFTFTRAATSDGLTADDPLVGHTAILRGKATKGTRTIDFTAIIDSPEGRQLIGVPFETVVTAETRNRLGVRLEPRDPLEGDTLFDGVDFAALDPDGDGQVDIAEGATEPAVADAYNLLRRTFQTHDQFEIIALPSTEAQ